MVGATLPLWIPASARMTNSVAGDNYFRTNDETGGWWDSEALSKPRNIIFVPIVHAGCRRRIRGWRLGALVGGRIRVSSAARARAAWQGSICQAS